MTLQDSLSQAVRVQALREGMSLTRVAKRTGMNPNTFFERTSNHKEWSTGQIDRIAHALNLSSGWALLNIARQEEKMPATGIAGSEAERR